MCHRIALSVSSNKLMIPGLPANAFLKPEYCPPRMHLVCQSWDSPSMEALVVGAWCPCEGPAAIHSQSLWVRPASAAPALAIQTALRQMQLA